MTPVLVAPRGGTAAGLPVDETFATARSVEFDAIMVGGNPVPTEDATPSLDQKAGAPAAAGIDPRLALMIQECWRHAKAIGAWGRGRQVIAEAGVQASPGVVEDDHPGPVLDELTELLGAHRVWQRFTPERA